MIIIWVIISSVLFFCTFLFAQDGTYDATVQTDSGSYSVPVEVENGEVTYVHWPNGGDMSVSGAEISNGEAEGTNSRGDPIHIEIDNYEEGEYSP